MIKKKKHQRNEIFINNINFGELLENNENTTDKQPGKNKITFMK